MYFISNFYRQIQSYTFPFNWFIDDFLSINDVGEFGKSFWDTYPTGLELQVEN